MFSILMTILWSSVLITFFSLLRTRTKLLHICSISTVILLYLFCAVRLVFPFELPWAHVVSGGAVYRGIESLLTYKVRSIRICELLCVIWIIGALYNLARYFMKYYKAMRCIQRLPQEESRAGQEILDGLDRSGRIRVLKSAGIQTPCCIGVFWKRIFLPARVYGREELWYILLHEYTHLAHNDILLKVLITVLCGIYWWNPLVYLLRKDLNQSMEIRCDLSVTRNLGERERADYLNVMLKTFCEDGQPDPFVGAAGLVEEHSKSLLERFRIVADMGVVQEKRVSVCVGVLMLLVLMISYSFILQSQYEAPLSEIETGDNIYKMDVESSYIIRQGDTYILYTEGTETVIDEDVAMGLQEEGFSLKGSE